MKQKKLILIDGNAYVHRAYHALPMMFDPTGNAVNAVYGFVKMLNRLIDTEAPSHICVAFDTPKPTFRHENFVDYKANRKESDIELKQQFPVLFEVLRAYNVSFIEAEGFEADDIIATLLKNYRKQYVNSEVLIVTGDKDIFQLIADNISIIDGTLKSKRHVTENVKNKFGVFASQIIDYLSLIGDKSDNLPGVAGIGPVTARKLLEEFGNLDGIYDNLEKIKGSASVKLQENKKAAYMTRDLVLLKDDVPLKLAFSDCEWTGFNTEEMMKVFEKLNFKSLLPTQKPKRTKQLKSKIKIDLVNDVTVLKERLANIETDSLLVVELVGDVASAPFAVAIATEQQKIYIPIAHNYLGVGKQLSLKEVCKSIVLVLNNKKIRVSAFDIKSLYSLFKNNGVDIPIIFFDVITAHYVLTNETGVNNLSDIARVNLSRETEEYAEGQDALPIAELSLIAASRMDAVLELTKLCYDALKKQGKYDLYIKYELPVIKVIAEMEIVGIYINSMEMKNISLELRKRIESLEKIIYDDTQENFNINSPAQVARILFEVIGLKPVRKTKNGYSTGEDVLQKLSKEHPLPEKLLEYRKLQKLISTYVDPLPKLISPITGRLHTTFHINGTATGRFSSSNPNLQNIPVRSKEGRLIRRAFSASEGKCFLSADYSQIDLRVLAHVSGDKNMVSSFKAGKDLHVRTAAGIYDIEEDKVSPEMRKRSKAINFGIAYGMSSRALSEQTDLSKEEAKMFIEKYFEQYPGIKTYMEKTIAKCHKQHYVSTILNRTRYLPDINSSNHRIRSLSERIAINTPIQGSSADIIKKAMVDLDKIFNFNNSEIKLLLQIHDELLFEINEEDLDSLKGTIKEIMENSIELSVPLSVELKSGKNWMDLKKC